MTQEGKIAGRAGKAVLGFLLTGTLLVYAWVGLFVRLAHGADGEGIDGSVPSAYKLDRQEAAYRSGITAVDSTGSASAALGVATFDAFGRKNVPVSARFSKAADTCKVRLYAYWDKPPVDTGTAYFLGCSDEITLTASGVQDASGKYVSPTYVFDGFGGNSLRVVVTSAPTAGASVDLWVGSY